MSIPTEEKPEQGIKEKPRQGAELSESGLVAALSKKSEHLLEDAEKLAEQGYTELRYLGDAEEQVKENVRKVLPEIPGGYLAQIVEAWKDATKSPSQPKPVAAPKLPKGAKIDLTHEKFALDGDEPTFEIPKSITVPEDRQAVRVASELTDFEWLTVAVNNRLVYGVDLEDAFSDGGNFQPDHAALVWKVPKNMDFLVVEDDARTSMSMAYSSRLENFSRARVAGTSLQISAPFVGASAEASRAEQQAQAHKTKTLRMTGMWNFPRVRLRLRYCTALSDRFADEIRTALSLESRRDRFDALRGLLREYGHVVPDEVLLGGQMYFSTSRDVTGSVDSSKVEQTVKAAVDIRSPTGSGGSAGAYFEDASGNKVEASSLEEATKWHAIGGDGTMVESPGDWANSVKNPNSWRVIERRGLTSVIDLLPEDLKQRVRDEWNEGLGGMWAGFEPPEGWVFPPMNGLPFTISNHGATTSPVLKGERLPSTLSPAERIVEPIATTDGMADPLGKGCLWKLVYTGRTMPAREKRIDLSGDVPIFWVATFDPETADDVSGQLGAHEFPIMKRQTWDTLLAKRYPDGGRSSTVCESVEGIVHHMRDGNPVDGHIVRPGAAEEGADGLFRFWVVYPVSYGSGLTLISSRPDFAGISQLQAGKPDTGQLGGNDPTLLPWRVTKTDAGWRAARDDG